jgi:hypothetical protein
VKPEKTDRMDRMDRRERMERMERAKRAEKVERAERMKSRVHEKGFTGRSAGAFSRGVLPPCQRPSNRTIAAFLARFDLSEDKHNNAESIVATGAKAPRHLG